MLWILGGLDPTGGAGILRDFVTAGALAPELPIRVWPTAWTRQGHGGPAEARPLSAEDFSAQLAGAPAPAAVKVGLVPGRLVEAVREVRARYPVPWILDPVLAASAGGSMGADPVALLPLLCEVAVVTPNLPEARTLAGAGDEVDGEALAGRLHAGWGGPAVLLKGGHALPSARVVDLWIDAAGLHRFERPRVQGPDVRGTGCALATAIATGVACGHGPKEAAARAIAWLDLARAAARPRGPDGTMLLLR